mmetsp:Transcript_22662/g.57793  ORF Transcript_22662/g.57793 Transcript_22662/m.57793 type:complete len:167 (+) Transcript_22662:2-502(+)
MFQKYGYFVGCNSLGSFPFPNFGVAYTGGTWYSLPGKCPQREHMNQDEQCKKDQPGGQCSITPNGNATCTWHLEMAGEVEINALEGIASYEEFMKSNKTEYNETLDTGIGMDFWADKNSTAAAAKRVHTADELFKKKYPSMPRDADMPSPPCDFDFETFYGKPLDE